MDSPSEIVYNLIKRQAFLASAKLFGIILKDLFVFYALLVF